MPPASGGDKQEVIFANEGTFLADAPEVGEPVGPDLPRALALVRTVVVGYVERITEVPESYTRHEKLVASHPELRSRSLVKQRSYVDGVTGWLVEQSTEPLTAVLAAELGLACFYAGRTAAGNDPLMLVAEVDAAFEKLNQRG